VAFRRCMYGGEHRFNYTRLRRPESTVTLAGYCSRQRATCIVTANSFCVAGHCQTHFRQISQPSQALIFDRPFEETRNDWYGTAAEGRLWCVPVWTIWLQCMVQCTIRLLV